MLSDYERTESFRVSFPLASKSGGAGFFHLQIQPASLNNTPHLYDKMIIFISCSLPDCLSNLLCSATSGFNRYGTTHA